MLAHAYQPSAQSTLAAVTTGVTAIGTVGAFAWYRTSGGRLGARSRRVLGRAGMAWGALFVVALGTPPYFVATCDCGWVGAAHEATDPEARDHAFHEAHGHGTEVAPGVERPLG